MRDIHLRTAVEIFGEDIARRLLAAENGDGVLVVSPQEFNRVRDAIDGAMAGVDGPPRLYLCKRVRVEVVR